MFRIILGYSSATRMQEEKVLIFKETSVSVQAKRGHWHSMFSHNTRDISISRQIVADACTCWQKVWSIIKNDLCYSCPDVVCNKACVCCKVTLFGKRFRLWTKNNKNITPNMCIQNEEEIPDFLFLLTSFGQKHHFKRWSLRLFCIEHLILQWIKITDQW